jgi:cobalt/nickel transport system permease protein
MFLLDWYADQSRFKNVHPGEKALFTMVCLFITLLFSREAVSLTVIMILSLLLLLVVRIPYRFYFKLLLLPFSFLFIGSIAVALETAPLASPALLAINLGQLSLGVTRSSLSLAINLFLRSLAAVFALYFLALTTPFSHLSWLLRRLKVPPFIIELATLTYRFIFVLAETASCIFTAQNSRLGYSSWRNAFKSLGIMAASLLVKSYHRSQMLHIALLSRCYDGEFKSLEAHYQVSPLNWLIITAFTLFLVKIAYFFS